jgi:hypothetical protein
MPLEEHEAAASTWRQLMEAGALFFDDAPLARKVHFLHPSDAGALMRHFRRPAAAVELSQLSRDDSLWHLPPRNAKVAADGVH